MFDTSNLATIYVSQKNGNNDNQGFFPEETPEGTGPVKTLECALEKVAQLRKFNALQPITIIICDDVYSFTAPVIINKNVSDVTIEPLNKCLLSGGIAVNNFKPDAFNNTACFSADLSHLGDICFTDFYVNGKPASRTRYPADGTLEPEKVENEKMELWENSKWVIAKKEDYIKIKNFKNSEDCCISFNHYWIDEHTPIESFDDAECKITFKYASVFTITPKQESSKMHYYVENVAEMFEKPGQWYYDKETKKLCYIPLMENIKAEDIQGYIPITDKLFCVYGETDSKVKNIHLRKFDIAYTKGDYKSMDITSSTHPESYKGLASDKQSMCAAHGTVEFKNAYGCSLEDCNLYCLGVHGVVVEEGSSNIKIINNSISYMGAGAIRVNGGAYGETENTYTHTNLISNNHIHHCGNRYNSGCGVLIMHSYENTVSHNTIHDIYYSGISCGWSWGYEKSIAHSNIIEKNHIYNIGKSKLSDMGGIYLLGVQQGTIVRGNIIHEVNARVYGGWAIYADEGCSCVTFENNICYRASHGLFHQHYGSMNVVKNNIFAFAPQPVSCHRPEMHTGIIAERNIIITDGVEAFSVGYGPEGRGATYLIKSANNLIYDIGEKEPVILLMKDKAYSLKEVQTKFNFDINSVCENPQFNDIENFDFSFKSMSAVCKIGFKPFNTSDVGIKQ